jgi:hypothetical protein
MGHMNIVFAFIAAFGGLSMWLVLYERWNLYLTQVAYSLEERPFVFRLLLPLLSRSLEWLTGIEAVSWLGVLFVLSAVFFYFSAKYLYEAFYERGEIAALVSFLFLMTLTFVETKVYDYATAAFFALSLGLLAKGKHGVFLLVFPFATLNRETTFLLTIFYAVYFFRKLPLQKYLASLSVQTSVYLSIRFVTASVFSGNGGQDVYFYFDVMLASRSYIILLIFPLLYFFLRNKPEFIRKSFWIIFPVQVALYLLFGQPFEVRVFAESSFIILLVDTGLRGRHRLNPARWFC